VIQGQICAAYQPQSLGKCSQWEKDQRNSMWSVKSSPLLETRLNARVCTLFDLKSIRRNLCSTFMRSNTLVMMSFWKSTSFNRTWKWSQKSGSLLNWKIWFQLEDCKPSMPHQADHWANQQQNGHLKCDNQKRFSNCKSLWSSDSHQQWNLCGARRTSTSKDQSQDRQSSIALIIWG